MISYDYIQNEINCYKFQISNSKLQKEIPNSKSQEPISFASWNLAFIVWNLGFGAFLELGIWNLEFFLVHFLYILSEELLGRLSGDLFEYPVKSNSIIKSALIGNGSQAIEIFRYYFLTRFIDTHFI
ncbi:hypothetical protein ABIE54_000122 [Chitinophagaceae bacterium OAS944]